MKISLGEGLFD